MKFNIEKLQRLAKPLPDKERLQMEHQIENQGWLLMSVRLALKIRHIMASECMSQSELARRMGVSPTQVSKILSGHENLSLKTIAKVEAALGKALMIIESGERSENDLIGKRFEYVQAPGYIESMAMENDFTSIYSNDDSVKNK